MKTMNKRIFLVTCGMVILLGGIAIYKKNYLLSSSHNIQSVNKISISTPIPTGSGTVTDPTTWSKYSFQHNFTLSYPPRWEVLPDKDGNGVEFQTPFFHQDDDFTMPYGDSTDILYSIFGQADLSDMSLQNGNQFPDNQTQETEVVTNVQHMQIDNLPAVEFDFYPTDNTHFVKTRIAIQKGKKLYRFDATYAEQSGKALFEQMVKTIHFS